MAVALYEIGEDYRRLLGANDFHVKVESQRFSAVAHVVVRTSNLNITRRRLAD